MIIIRPEWLPFSLCPHVSFSLTNFPTARFTKVY